MDFGLYAALWSMITAISAMLRSSSLRSCSLMYKGDWLGPDAMFCETSMLAWAPPRRIQATGIGPVVTGYVRPLC